MMKKLFYSVCLLPILAFAASLAEAQQTFRGIVPLVTTQSEVERKLGKPNDYGLYELEEGSIYINYCKTKCEVKIASCLCVVPIGTVLTIEIAPSTDRYIRDLKLDPNLWTKANVQGDHFSGMQVYVNEKAGMFYTVNSTDGWIRNLTYDGSEETCRVLRETQSNKKLFIRTNRHQWGHP
jgi:hypothetical protein